MAKIDSVANRRRVATLRKRLAHLEARIASSPKRLTYDEEEAAALRWALGELRALGYLVD